jgi:hypothetical protein
MVKQIAKVHERHIMKKLVILSIVLFSIILLAGIYSPQPTYAGRMSLPAGWNINVIYCTNGLTAELEVPASITAGVTHRGRVAGVIPAINTDENIDKFFSADGVGGFTSRRNYFWDTVQSVGTNVTAYSVRWEDTTRINANESDSDTVGDCLVSPNLITPVHKFHTSNHFPIFNWTPVTGADMYRVWVYNANRVYSVKERTIGNGATTFTWEENLPAGTYFWRVRGRDANSGIWSPWSPRHTLFID